MADRPSNGRQTVETTPPTETVSPLQRPVRYDEIWQSSLFRPLLITLLIGCIDVAFIGLLRHVFADMPAAHAQLFLALGIGSTLIAGYTTTLLIRPDQRDRRTTGYRLAELGLILFLTRVILWNFVDGWPAASEIIYRPFEAVLTGSFFIAILIVLISWGAAALVTGQFLEMALRPDELSDRLPDRYRAVYDSRLRSDRRSMLSRFTEFWIAGGVFMLLLTSASQFGPSSNGLFAISRQAIAPEVIGSAVVYFLTGLILIAIGRLAILRAQWQIEEVNSAESIARNWPIYVVALIGIMGTIAALLPLGGTFWLARILMAIVNFIYFVIYFILGLIMALFMSVMPANEEAPPSPPPAQFEPPPVETTQAPVDMAPWLGGAVFWIIMALLLGYAAYIYLSGKGFQFGWLQAWWQRLRASWLLIWQSYRQWRVSAKTNEQGEEEVEVARWRNPLSWLRLRGMDPTQRVRYFYLSMLDQAGEQGIKRRPGETPFQFAPRLEEAVADEEQPVTLLTERFVEIHFASRPVPEEVVPYFEQIWQRIRKAIQALAEK
jgi:uncharacterized membrane protein YidH (DUF202 family)